MLAMHPTREVELTVRHTRFVLRVSLFKPLLLAAVLASLLAYVLLFTPDRPPPPPVSPDPLTAAAQWLAGSLLLVLLAGRQSALVGVGLALLLCVAHAWLRSVSFTSRTHARAAIAAGRTPVVQALKRMSLR